MRFEGKKIGILVGPGYEENIADVVDRVDFRGAGGIPPIIFV